MKAVAGELGEEELEKTLDQAGEATAELLAERSQAAAATRALLEVLREQHRGDGEEEPALTAPLAARWLNHSISMQEEAVRFREDAAELKGENWQQQLRDYSDALEHAAELAPRDGLERLSKQEPRARSVAAPRPAEEVLRAANFGEEEFAVEEVGPVLRELSDALDRQVTGLRQLGQRLEAHPARRFGKHAEAVMAALCRFELARTLRREGPILQASEQLVCRLLDERLAPVVRELTAAIVRFEWYFKPLQMSSDGRKVVLGGLATERAGLDARLLLNSAERPVLGLSWF